MALFRPPKHLLEQILTLRAPVREVNVRLLLWLMERAQIRPGLTRERAVRYLEGMEAVFRSAVDNWTCNEEQPDLHTMLERAGEMADLILFGVLRQPPEPVKTGGESRKAQTSAAGTILEDKEH